MKTQKPKTVADFKVEGQPLLSAKNPLENGDETALFNGHSTKGKLPGQFALTIWKDGQPYSLEMDEYGIQMLISSLIKSMKSNIMSHPFLGNQVLAKIKRDMIAICRNASSPPWIRKQGSQLINRINPILKTSPAIVVNSLQ